MRRSAKITLLMFLTATAALAKFNIPSPGIPPGYRPAEAQDEKGIWLELQEYELAIKRSALLVKDPEVNAYVRNATCTVAGDYCDDLRVYVIRNPYFNASMSANGVVQVWTGLLVRVSSEDELAAVLGHELAHYTQLHTLERMRKASDDLAKGSLLDFGLLILTGVSVPVAQMSAVAGLMAFSREHETEADLLGTRYMADAGYDPNAAVDLWSNLVEEEALAVTKRQEPGLFTKTHPSSVDRVDYLRRFVDEEYPGRESGAAGRERHLAMLNDNYMMLMEDQLDTNRFGRTSAMLARHREIGVQPELVEYFYGAMYQQRDRENDVALATEAYMNATGSDSPVPQAHMELGYIYMKQDDLASAQAHFRKYLELMPEADDREMIEFYLQMK